MKCDHIVDKTIFVPTSMFIKTKMVFIRTLSVCVFLVATRIQLSSSTKADADINQSLMEKLRVLEEKFAKLEKVCKQSTMLIEEMRSTLFFK